MQIPQPVNLKINKSGYFKDGQWANVLEWNDGASKHDEFVVFRKYINPIFCYGDGTQLGITSKTYFIDRDIQIGAPTYYSVYTKQGPLANKNGASIYAGIRRDDVFSIEAHRITAGEIQITWKTKAELVDCLIRRGFQSAPRSFFGGEKIFVVDPNGKAVDSFEDHHKKVYYSIWAIYKDPVLNKRQYSQGIKIELDFSTINKIAVQKESRIYLNCAYCHNSFKPHPDDPDERMVICNNCNSAHHFECWKEYRKCAQDWCNCLLFSEEDQ